MGFKKITKFSNVDPSYFFYLVFSRPSERHKIHICKYSLGKEIHYPIHNSSHTAIHWF